MSTLDETCTWVWEYYKKGPHNTGKVKCNECGTIFLYAELGHVYDHFDADHPEETKRNTWEAWFQIYFILINETIATCFCKKEINISEENIKNHLKNEHDVDEKNTRNWIWKLIKNKLDADFCVQCDLCFKTFLLQPARILKEHLKNKHPCIYQRLVDTMDKEKCIIKEIPEICVKPKQSLTPYSTVPYSNSIIIVD